MGKTFLIVAFALNVLPSYVIAGVINNKPMSSDTVNQVKSVYPLDDFAKRIVGASKNGKLVVINKSKVEQMLTAIGVQPAEALNILNLAKDSISPVAENVKKNISVSHKNEQPSTFGTSLKDLYYDGVAPCRPMLMHQ